MPYTLNKTDGTTLLTLADGTVDTTRTITYVGKNYANYGEVFNENFVKLQENFAKNTTPSGALDGQLWYDKTNNVLKVYRGGVLSWTSIPMTTSVTGTVNRVTVNTTASTGAITLSSPQDIHTAADPTFNRLTLSQVTGLSPLTVSSNTLVTNLNSDLLDDQEGSYYLDYNNFTNTPSLGTLASQNDSTVAITGGSISDVILTSGNATITGGAITVANFTSANATITGGSITGITALALVDGGTGASTAADARANLGLGTIATENSNDVTTTVVQAALNAVYPVGSIYINATNSTNPGTLLGFGTWSAFGAGRVPVGFNASDPLFDSAEETGGSKDAVVVAHTHTFSANTGNQSANHTHSGTTDSAGAHTHTALFGNSTGGNQFFFEGRINQTGTISDGINSAGTHTHTFTTGNASADHTHAVSGSTGSTGTSATNANLQPYITVYMWKRTA